MTRQEKIREGIKGIETLWYREPPEYTVAPPYRSFAGHLLHYLHSQGIRLPDGSSLIKEE